MKVRATVLKSEKTKDGFFARLQFNAKLPKEGDVVTVKWGKVRSKDQNALYWCFLEWLLENGMKEQGYQFKEDLHKAFTGNLLKKVITCKAGFTSTYIKSTTDLTADEFMTYIDDCEALIREHCGIDCQPFWQEYQEVYANY